MSNLAFLLKEMRPVLHHDPYDFTLADHAPDTAFATVREAEGLTVIVPSPEGAWARISLSVHSSLSAVGLTAAFARALATQDIPCNVVAGFHHDHLFVPWGRRHDAMQALAAVSGASA